MSLFVHLIPFLIVIFGIINLLRMTLYLIGSDIYTLRKHQRKNRKYIKLPKISVIIPAYNEEKSIISTIQSIRASVYPFKKIEIIVVSDGSTDTTEKIVHDYIVANHTFHIRLILQPNLGKAHALNNGIKNYATGELVMCLDADSFLDKYALRNATNYFADKNVMALSANVKIAKGNGLLNFVQTFEYILCYQMKRAQTIFNIEYIIGGIGSTFRKSYLESVNYYDVDTVTEDIDLTMKLLRGGNKYNRVVYGSDVIAFTQGALSILDLIRQRYRWKWGRYQTFYKNKSMFFSRGDRFTKGLTWFSLPYAIFADMAFLFEPFILVYLLSIVVIYRDFVTLFSTLSVMTFYVLMSILAEDTLSPQKKARHIIVSPIIYLLFTILSFVEYVALIKAIVRLPKLVESINHKNNSWKPVARTGLLNY